MDRLVASVLICLLGGYSVLLLPRYTALPDLSVPFLVGVAIAVVASAGSTWARRGVIRATASGLALLGGLMGLFWPSVEVLFQSVDGGGMTANENGVFLGSIAMYVVAIVASVVVVRQPRAGLRLLSVAVSGIAIAGIVAPDSPPGAWRELLFGLPFVIGAAVAAWRSSAGLPNRPLQPTSGARIEVE